MKTSCFTNYAGPGRVSIARLAPRGTPAGFRIYKPLAPGPWFNSVDRAEYERLYREQLSKLDAQATWNELQRLANEKVPEMGGGVEPVLLCWEKPPFTETNFCHRRMVAEWFFEHLGHDVRELGDPADQGALL